MSKYLITYKHVDDSDPQNTVTDMHPADWLADQSGGSATTVILFVILITDTQYEKLAELGYICR